MGRSNIREFIDNNSTDIVPIPAISLTEVYDYTNHVYTKKEISGYESMVIHCKHNEYNIDDKCVSCKRSRLDIEREEALFNFLIWKNITRDQVIAMSIILNDQHLYLRFDKYLEKLKRR